MLSVACVARSEINTSKQIQLSESVRRLLSKYGYPPDLQEAATKLVLRQAELMAEGVAGRR